MTLLKRHRLALGLDQRAMSSRCGVTIQAYSAWETGRNFPRPKRIKTLARILNMTPMELTRVIVPEDQHHSDRSQAEQPAPAHR